MAALKKKTSTVGSLGLLTGSARLVTMFACTYLAPLRDTTVDGDKSETLAAITLNGVSDVLSHRTTRESEKHSLSPLNVNVLRNKRWRLQTYDG